MPTIFREHFPSSLQSNRCPSGRFALVDAVLKVGVVFCFGLFGYLLSKHGFDNHYVLIPSVGLLLLALLYLPSEFRVNATLVIVSSLMTLYAANVVLAVKAEVDQVYPRSQWLVSRAGARHVPALATAAEQQGYRFDTRSPFDVMLELRAKGVDVWPTLAAEFLFKDYPEKRENPIIELRGEPTLPLGGISNKVTVYCNENGSYILLDSDEHGFSNPRGLWSLPQIDVAIVGDSFVRGACVPKEDSFPAILRRRLPATLNLGNDANGPLALLGTLREYLPSRKPKIVLWVYCESNDLTDLIRERRGPLLKYLDVNYTQNLERKQEEIDQALMHITNQIMSAGTPRGMLSGLLGGLADRHSYYRELEPIVKLTHVWNLISTSQSAYVVSADSMDGQEVASDDFRLFHDVLKLGRDLVGGWGGKMIFVYLPHWERYSGKGVVSPHRQKVLETASELGIPIVDIHPVFARQPDPLALFPFRQAAHYNSNGYQLVAQEIERHLAGHPHRHKVN